MSVCDFFLFTSTQCCHACWHVHLIHIFHAHSAWLKTSSKPRSTKRECSSHFLSAGVCIGFQGSLKGESYLTPPRPPRTPSRPLEGTFEGGCSEPAAKNRSKSVQTPPCPWAGSSARDRPGIPLAPRNNDQSASFCNELTFLKRQCHDDGRLTIQTHPQLQLLLGDTFSLLRIRWNLKLFSSLYCFPEPLFVSQSSWPWTSFCFRGFWFMSINPILMSTGASVVSLSPIFISQSSLLSCWSASGSLLAALNSWCISMHALFGLLRSLRCLFPCVLVVSCAPYLFLASFIYIRKFIISSPTALIYCQCFPCWFSRILFFPYPRASFKVLNFSAYFLAFRQLLYFLVYFDRFAFICSFLWVWFVSLSLSPMSFLP